MLYLYTPLYRGSSPNTYRQPLNTTILHLGSNLGDRKQTLEEARRQLEVCCGTLERVSGLYETAPWGLTTQPDYLNQAILLHTPLSAHELLRQMQAIEDRLGRERKQHWGPRTLDIDLLFFNREIIRDEHLQVPHPHLADRRFVLIPLVEIAPDWIHPENGKTCSMLLDQCTDSGIVKPYIE